MARSSGGWRPEWDDDPAPADFFSRRLPQPSDISWREPLHAHVFTSDRSVDDWPRGREVTYVVNVPASRAAASLVLEIGCRQQKRNGGAADLEVPGA